MECLLRLARDATGAERAFFAVAPEAAQAELRLLATSSTGDDRRPQPSRSAVLRAIAAERAWICNDGDDAMLGVRSVQALDLRSILAAPVALPPPTRAALVLDSRRPLDRPPRELRATVESFATLVALAVLASEAGRPLPPAPAPTETEAPHRSRVYRSLLAWVRRIAPSELPVLIGGESGSGKEQISRMVHALSRRRLRPFLALNCAALTETLLEAELFGARRGAYTGAARDRPGLFVQASGGTLLLDEVGDMPAAMQAKLLRAVEQGRVRPVGGDVEVAADVRVVAATHRDLSQEVDRGRFRADLYHRLAVLHVRVPPLRERLDDLPTLIGQLGPRLLRETGYGPPRLTAAALERLRHHAWPGNVRELHAALARALLRTAGAPIEPDDLELLGEPAAPASACASLERSMIANALDQARGNVTAAAARIGWSRQKLYRRLVALGISRSAPGTTSSDSSTFQ